MPEMKTLNGYEIVDAKAREDIASLQENGAGVKTHYFGAVQSFSALTAEDKEVLTYVISQVVAWKEPSDYLLYYRLNNNYTVFLLNYFSKDYSSNYVYLSGQSSSGYTMTLKVGFNSSTYAPTSLSTTYEKPAVTIPDTYATKTYVDEVLGVIENGSY
jgi:hypothetical protein